MRPTDGVPRDQDLITSVTRFVTVQTGIPRWPLVSNQVVAVRPEKRDAGPTLSVCWDNVCDVDPACSQYWACVPCLAGVRHATTHKQDQKGRSDPGRNARNPRVWTGLRTQRDVHFHRPRKVDHWVRQIVEE